MDGIAKHSSRLERYGDGGQWLDGSEQSRDHAVMVLVLIDQRKRQGTWERCILLVVNV
jgi:hypothetical protein